MYLNRLSYKIYKLKCMNQLIIEQGTLVQNLKIIGFTLFTVGPTHNKKLKTTIFGKSCLKIIIAGNYAIIVRTQEFF